MGYRSRIDQKTCLKAITAAGLDPEVVELVKKGDELVTDVEVRCPPHKSLIPALIPSVSSYSLIPHNPQRIRTRLDELGGADGVACIVTTTSCFAPRCPDDVVAVAKLCQAAGVPHIINNAYGWCPSSQNCLLSIIYQHVSPLFFLPSFITQSLKMVSLITLPSHSPPLTAFSYHLTSTLSYHLTSTLSYHLTSTLSYHLIPTLSYHLTSTLSYQALLLLASPIIRRAKLSNLRPDHLGLEEGYAWEIVLICSTCPALSPALLSELHCALPSTSPRARRRSGPVHGQELHGPGGRCGGGVGYSVPWTRGVGQ